MIPPKAEALVLFAHGSGSSRLSPRNRRVAGALQEAEEMADRIGVINKGEIILVEDKDELMRKLGRKQLTLQLQSPLERIPPSLERHGLQLAAGGSEMIYTYDEQADRDGIASLLRDLARSGIAFRDVNTTQSSLEDIFVDLVNESR